MGSTDGPSATNMLCPLASLFSLQMSDAWYSSVRVSLVSPESEFSLLFDSGLSPLTLDPCQPKPL